MNGSQKLVLFVGCIFLVISGLFPFWVHIYPGHDSFEDNTGRHFIMDPPHGIPIGYTNYVETTTQLQIDLEKLFREWLVIIGIAGIIILFLVNTQTAKKTVAPFDRRFPGSFLIALFLAGIYISWFPVSRLGSAPIFLIFIALPMILVLFFLLFFDILLNIVHKGFRWMRALLLIEGILVLSFSVWWVMQFLRYVRM